MATPFLIETPSNFATITGSTNITIPVPNTGAGTPVTIGTLTLPLSSRNDVVFIEGTIPLVLSVTSTTAAINLGSLDVILEVFRSTTSTAPIFRSRQTIVSGLTVATGTSTTIYDVLPFQFVDDPILPLCGAEADYVFRMYVVVSGLTGNGSVTVTVNSTTQGLFYNITAEEKLVAGALGDPIIPETITP
ncbi:hypothetical protein [Clostridium fungisolvens]|uniref:Uncharacterized protein n=1 Tax=Clostridium fungisolvens TaxID=1604897 RepID=A0A6V8SIU6_9CLOT|nr:hypothetical protein [Clostridium fungisolvens]GFP77154.1 hypothetical protein bsdtw1_03268 [Clostridium fungisolvens]